MPVLLPLGLEVGRITEVQTAISRLADVESEARAQHTATAPPGSSSPSTASTTPATLPTLGIAPAETNLQTDMEINNTEFSSVPIANTPSPPLLSSILPETGLSIKETIEAANIGILNAEQREAVLRTLKTHLPPIIPRDTKAPGHLPEGGVEFAIDTGTASPVKASIRGRRFSALELDEIRTKIDFWLRQASYHQAFTLTLAVSFGVRTQQIWQNAPLR
jgi:hypothetical protein